MSRTDLKHIVPVITESRLARQYAEIRARAPSAPPRERARLAWSVAACATIALVAVVVHADRTRPSALVGDTVIESGPAVGDGKAGTGTVVTIADGSRVELGPATRARLASATPKAIRIDLERGSVDIEATHVDGRTFVVRAGDYDVRVVGTHFTVRRDPDERVVVRVDRGLVEVATTSGSGETRRLAAGEQWSASERKLEPSSAPELPPGPPAPSETVVPSGGPSPSASTQATNSTPARHDEGAKDLFDDAQRARAEGRSSEAARAFDRLRRTFPRDPRAALAAFELGRLRLDVLGDPRGGEEALRDAMALGPSSPFREDAEARRVEALRRAGDPSACAVARDAYLARWPNGTYRRSVELGCGDR